MVKLPILLSTGFVPVVKVNDYVKAGQLVASKAGPKEYIITIPKELSISIDKARKCLKKSPGDAVVVGDVLAVKKSFLGLNEEKIISRVNGIVSRYERDSGNLVIQVGSGVEKVGDVVSPVDGMVVICNNNIIVIGTDKDVYPGTKGIGESATGETFILDGALKGENYISLYYTLDSRAIGKIIVGGNFSRELLIKSIGMGVIGIVGTNIIDADIEYLVRRNMMVPIIEVDNNTIEKIVQWKDKKIYLNSPEKHILLLHA